MSKSEKDKDNKQVAIDMSYYNIDAEINKYLKMGYKFIAQFKKHNSDNDHVVLFEKSDSKKTNDKKPTRELRKSI